MKPLSLGLYKPLKYSSQAFRPSQINEEPDSVANSKSERQICHFGDHLYVVPHPVQYVLPVEDCLDRVKTDYPNIGSYCGSGGGGGKEGRKET